MWKSICYHEEADETSFQLVDTAHTEDRLPAESNAIRTGESRASHLTSLGLLPGAKNGTVSTDEGKACYCGILMNLSNVLMGFQVSQ